MAFSLRLPPALEADARLRCDRLGISLNALVCVALDAYLRGTAQSATEERTPTGVAVAPLPAVVEAPKACPEPVVLPTALPALIPRQKPVLTAPPLPTPPPVPVVDPALSRAERRRLERLAKKKR